jgi:hypothetical protein
MFLVRSFVFKKRKNYTWCYFRVFLGLMHS